MEPTNHPFRKENDLNQTSMIMFQPLIFHGVTVFTNFMTHMAELEERNIHKNYVASVDDFSRSKGMVLFGMKM